MITISGQSDPSDEGHSERAADEDCTAAPAPDQSWNSFSFQSHHIASDMFETRLKQLDTRIATEAVSVYTLATDGREGPTPFEQVGMECVQELSEETAQEAFVALCERLVDATLLHYPNTLFWDHDCLLHAVVTCARKVQSPEAYLTQYADSLEQLYTLYGSYSAIRFQYVHDFTYGYDFERWGGPRHSDPQNEGEFSHAYLRFLIKKGRTITRRIEQGAEGFPQIDKGEFRNTYPFSRELPEEKLLFETLAQRDLLPIAAWSKDGLAQRVAGKEYRPVRQEVAEELQAASGD